MAEMYKYRTQHLRGTKSEWQRVEELDKVSAIPLSGEIVIELDEENKLHKLKIGDGITPYSELAYLMAGDEIVTQVLAQASPNVITVHLTTEWVEEENGKYKQIVELNNITRRSRVDLQPNADMLAEFKS